MPTERRITTYIFLQKHNETILFMKTCETPNIKWTYFKGMNPYMIFRK